MKGFFIFEFQVWHVLKLQWCYLFGKRMKDSSFYHIFFYWPTRIYQACSKLLFRTRIRIQSQNQSSWFLPWYHLWQYSTFAGGFQGSSRFGRYLAREREPILFSHDGGEEIPSFKEVLDFNNVNRGRKYPNLFWQLVWKYQDICMFIFRIVCFSSGLVLNKPWDPSVSVLLWMYCELLRFWVVGLFLNLTIGVLYAERNISIASKPQWKIHQFLDSCDNRYNSWVSISEVWIWSLFMK